MKLKNFYFATLLFSFFIFSCSEDDEPTPDTLVVNAGSDQTVDVGELVNLIGIATDASGNALTFSWIISSKPSGSTAALSGANGENPTFTPDVEGEYVISLSVNNTINTKTDEVKITAEGVPLKTIELSGTISEDSILVDIFTDDTPDYLVTGNLLINGTAKLTIKPGVIIAIEADERIWVDGDAIIDAQGTTDNKIIFTGKQESAGYWKGLVIWTKSNENILDYVEVKYGGSGDHGFGIGKTTLGIGDEGKLSIKNSIISNSGGYGLFVETGATFNEFMNNEIKNNTGIAAAMNISQTEKLDNISKFSEGNGDNSIELFGSTLDQSVAITVPAFDDKTPYYVTGNLAINSGLIISPGVTFGFASDKRFWVDDEGYLNAIGTEASPIVFTGKDETVGYWKGLVIWTNNLDNKLDYVEVSYGGSSAHGFGVGKTSLGIGDDGGYL
ncbi:MAG: hypothetical protein KTR26_12990, partial [Flammeovirgaceae bacterium]|nr:hypothetical protein [Flammeovirgaceae bacterium]